MTPREEWVCEHLIWLRNSGFQSATYADAEREILHLLELFQALGPMKHTA